VDKVIREEAHRIARGRSLAARAFVEYARDKVKGSVVRNIERLCAGGGGAHLRVALAPRPGMARHIELDHRSDTTHARVLHNRGDVELRVPLLLGVGTFPELGVGFGLEGEGLSGGESKRSRQEEQAASEGHSRR
jgi:hypothetical protein